MIHRLSNANLVYVGILAALGITLCIALLGIVFDEADERDESSFEEEDAAWALTDAGKAALEEMRNRHGGNHATRTRTPAES